MIIERSMADNWLSNTYLVGDEQGGAGVLIDAGGPLDPLFAKADELGLTVTHILLTHHHYDHIAELDAAKARYPEAPVLIHQLELEQVPGATGVMEPGQAIETGGLTIEPLHTPGHTAGMLSLLVNGTDVFTGDTLFRNSVGGVRAPGHTTFADIKHSIMDVLLALPPETTIHPGHTDPTTVAQEWEGNSFVRVWRGLDPEGDGQCTAMGDPGDARAARRRLRRRPQGVGALARRQRRHRPWLPGAARMSLKLGLNTGYWAGGPPPHVEAAVAEAERLGYDSMWTAEAYGSDCLTPLAWWGAKTESIRLGTAIVQMSARTPAATAMAAMTMDHLSDGRFILGLGVSGPQVVEGWYGQEFGKPLARTREYVSILRDIWARKGPLVHEGTYYRMPIEGGTGLGKALKSSIHPLREDIPVFLGAEGPKNIALAAEIADGWLALFYSPRHEGFYRDALGEGFAREGARRSLDDFEVCATVPFIVHDDVEAAADMLRPMYALYFGGMGAKGRNFHADVAIRMGYEAEVDAIQDLYLAGKKDEAAAKIPTSLVEELALIGPEDKIRDDLAAWEDSVVTTLLVAGDPQMLQTAADIVLG